MNPKPLVKAIIYALAYQRIGLDAYRFGLYVTPRGMVLL
jgi:hypothetical protein